MIASSMPGSVTVVTSSTSAVITARVSAPGRGTAMPSATVGGRSVGISTSGWKACATAG